MTLQVPVLWLPLYQLLNANNQLVPVDPDVCQQIQLVPVPYRGPTTGTAVHLPLCQIQLVPIIQTKLAVRLYRIESTTVASISNTVPVVLLTTVYIQYSCTTEWVFEYPVVVGSYTRAVTFYLLPYYRYQYTESSTSRYIRLGILLLRAVHELV